METLNKLTYQAGVTTHEDVLNNINSNADAANANFDAIEKNKQDNLTFDNTPTEGSNNPVTSGGVKSYVDKNTKTINDLIAEGYLFAGIATPSTNPGTPKGKVFYIAYQSGVYTNFNNINISDDYVSIIAFNNKEWSKIDTEIANKTITGSYVDNSEYIRAYIDSNGKILWGIKTDGTIEWAKGIPNPIKQMVIKLENNIQNKFDELNETINPLLESFKLVKTEEWIHAIIDANGKFLFGIKSDSGEIVIPNKEGYNIIKNEEWNALWLDDKNHIILGIRNDGRLFTKGIDSEVFDNIKKNVSLFELIDDVSERTEIRTDEDGKIIAYRDKQGLWHENVGVDVRKLLIDGTEKDFVDRKEFDSELEKSIDNGIIDITDINGISNHDTPNLLIAADMQKTFSDGVNSFTPPNDGYEMSNRIECNAGDWFTRTGTATGMVVVTDENDKNGVRLFNDDGTTLANTFQIPESMTWVKYIRMAADKISAENGLVVICKGKEAYTGEQNGEFVTINKLRIEKKNLSNDVMYIKSEDNAKYYELYVDANGVLKTREVDPEIIPDNELPSNWHNIKLTGNFGNYFDRFTIENDSFLIDLKARGPVKIFAFEKPLADNYCNFEHFYTSSGEERYAVSTVGEIAKGCKGITIFDKDMRIIETNIPCVDIHDFVYIADDHVIYMGYVNDNINVPGIGMTYISGAIAIWEIKKINGKWTELAHFYGTDYPELCTDAFGELGDAIGCHPNTVGLDYDGNIILNMRNWDSWIKVKRTVSEDGSVVIGSSTLNYDEAIIGRVGGRHNSGYIDSKRVLSDGFSFTDEPTSLEEVSSDDWEEWQWFHCHDVKYWGMKEINGKQYPTYTLFDNNYWTESKNNSGYNCFNKRNNINNNPKGDGRTYISANDGDAQYVAHTYSRVVQISIDWDNHKVVDYQIYYIPKLYSQEQGGATMYDEGIISIAYAYGGVFGLWDFTTEETQVSGHVHKGAKQLFLGEYGVYRANTYKINV